MPPSTTISFSLAEPGHALLRVYDVSGRLVNTLVDRELSAGRHSVRWKGLNQRGEHLSSGIYFCRMTAGDFTGSTRMVLLR
jgi:flagellar hook assembly protein FlgD